MTALRNLLARYRQSKARNLKLAADKLVPLAKSHRRGCLVARHEVRALRTAQLRAEMGR